MASAREEGTYRIYVRAPSGAMTKVWDTRSEYVGHGGAPDGAIANSPEKWPVAGVKGGPDGKPFGPGFEMLFAIVADGADTLDATDCRLVVPITLENGTGITISQSDEYMNAKNLADVALVAGVETIVCAHRAPEGRVWYFGGGPIFMSFEDDTA